LSIGRNGQKGLALGESSLMHSSQSTYEGTEAYRTEIQDTFGVIYDTKDWQMLCPESNIGIIENIIASQDVVFSSQDEWASPVFLRV